MKKMLLMILISFVTWNAYAAVPIQMPVTIDGNTVLMLNNIKDNKAMFKVNYPGVISGLCHLVISGFKTHRQLSQLTKVLQFRIDKPSSSPRNQIVEPTISSNALTFDLEKEVFIDTLTIESKDGQSIQSNIKSVFTDPHVKIVILAGEC